ncbi:hypothetical protein KKD91_00470 [Patescibacteria group bacterium]|nr:hypothetical protein [Patescibacteria group bacterium]
MNIFFYLLGKIFFPQKAVLSAFLNFAFSGAKVINIFSAALFDFSVRRYAIAALAAPRKIQKQKFLFLFPLFAGLAVIF